MPLPLEHIRVVDLGRVRSGPIAVRMLADMGADVVQVEAPVDHEGTFPRRGFDAQNMHRNKRSMTLDLKQPGAVDVLKRLVARADVVVENYRPDVKHRLGIDYESLAAVNERLVYASISGFGQTGPYRDRPGLDQVVQGYGGMMSINGLPGQGPVRVGISIADIAAGLYLAQGILVALVERERSGRGQWVHTSLLEAMVSLLDYQAARWLIDGVVPPQAGNHHPTQTPTGLYRTKDGHINIAASGQAAFRKLTTAIGAPHLVDDPRFVTPEERSRNREALNEALEAVLATRTSAEWREILDANDVVSGPVLDIRQVFEDPQVVHLGLATKVQHPALGELRVQAPPVTLSRTPGSVRTPAPDRGQHTDEILAQHGYSREEIAELRRRKVV